MSGIFELMSTSRTRPGPKTLVLFATLLLSGCALVGTGASPAPDPAASPTQAPTASPAQTEFSSPQGISEAEAIDIAEGILAELPEGGRELRVALEGPFLELYDVLVDMGPNQPDPDDIDADRMVWAVQYKVILEVCGPAGGDPPCHERPGIRTIFLDHETGDFLKVSDFGPSPERDLPTPYSVE